MKKTTFSLIKSKSYISILFISALFAYFYGITHSSIDIDDTAIPLYFQGGLAPYVQRWTLFVIFRLFHIAADYKHTFLIDGASVLSLCCSVTIWCGLWKWLFDKIVVLPSFVYGIIASIFITNPIISEVFIYFLHNGICISYGLTAIALYLFLHSTNVKISRKSIDITLSTLLLAAAVGCYESFMLVFVMGAFLIYILVRGIVNSEDKNDNLPSTHILPWIINGSIIIFGTLLIRTAMYHVCRLMYDSSAFSEYDVTYRHYFGDNLTAISELGITLKRYISLYHINAMMYLPISVLAFARIVICLSGLILFIKKKDITIFLATLIIVLLPPFMAVFEGNVTKYRSAQYIPMLSAFAILLFTSFIVKAKPKKSSHRMTVFIAILCVLIVFQCIDINKWFYVNHQKSEYVSETITKIAEDLQNGNYDLTKPIAFVGACQMPREITSYGSIPFTSRRFRTICMLTDPIDPHWKEKFYSSIPGLGYIYNATPQESILQWGTDAFNHTDEQMIRLMEMNGYTEFVPADKNTMIKAISLQEETYIPSINSGECYILETSDFILVNIDAN